MIFDRFRDLISRVRSTKPAPSRGDLSSDGRIDFISSAQALSLGTEVELQIIDKASLELTDLADDLLGILHKGPQGGQYVQELFKSIIEINSSVHLDANSMMQEMDTLLRQACDAAEGLGCALMGSGCHPTMHFEKLATRQSERYDQLIDRNQWLMRRWMVSGMHIHLGMASPQDCIRYMIYFEHFLPHFIALSASSPYWQSSDTGLESCRSIISESLPTASLIYTISSWGDFLDLVEKLRVSGTIQNIKDLHWDLRPSPGYGTLELRMFDMPTNIKDIAAITAFVHALALWFSTHGDWLGQMPKPTMWMARENKWRAMRYGLEAQLITDFEGGGMNLREDCLRWFERIQDVVREYRYEAHIAHLKDMMQRGNSTHRQRQVFANTASLEDVVRHNIREMQIGMPVYALAPVLSAQA